MKKIFKFLAIAVLATGFVACEDENEKTPEGSQQIDVPYVHMPDFKDSISFPLEIGLDANGNRITGADWMSLLEDTKPVCKVSIPGTHDAFTGMGFYDEMLKYIFNMTAISQVATFNEQLESGIRFFDVRPVVATDTITKEKVLRCAHGISEIALDFDEALEMLADFLEEHPTEFAIFKIQNDNGVENQMKFIPMMNDVLDDFDDAHPDVLFNDWHPGVTVGELRGKILIINRSYYPDHMYGAYGEWPDEDPDGDLHKNGERVNLEDETSLTICSAPDTTLLQCPMYVQDYYKTNETKIKGFSRLEHKKEAVKNLMAASRQDSIMHKNVWIINHCSAYTEVSPRGYATNAAAVHPVVISDILEHPCTNIGIIAMDFACYDRVEVIINAGTPYSSDYLFGQKPMSQSLTNLVIMNNFPQYFNDEYKSRHCLK